MPIPISCSSSRSPSVFGHYAAPCLHLPPTNQPSSQPSTNQPAIQQQTSHFLTHPRVPLAQLVRNARNGLRPRLGMDVSQQVTQLQQLVEQEQVGGRAGGSTMFSTSRRSAPSFFFISTDGVGRREGLGSETTADSPFPGSTPLPVLSVAR